MTEVEILTRKQAAAEQVRGRAEIPLTPEVIDAIAEMSKNGWPSRAAEAIGIKASRFREWMLAGEDQLKRLEAGEDPEDVLTDYDPDGLRALLYLTVQQAEAEAEMEYAAKFSTAIDSGADWRGAAAMLAKRWPDRWSERRAEVSTPPMLEQVALGFAAELAAAISERDERRALGEAAEDAVVVDAE